MSSRRFHKPYLIKTPWLYFGLVSSSIDVVSGAYVLSYLKRSFIANNTSASRIGRPRILTTLSLFISLLRSYSDETKMDSFVELITVKVFTLSSRPYLLINTPIFTLTAHTNFNSIISGFACWMIFFSCSYLFISSPHNQLTLSKYTNSLSPRLKVRASTLTSC